MVRPHNLLTSRFWMKVAYTGLFIAFSKDLPHKAHARQGRPPEQVRYNSVVRDEGERLIGSECRPIPQWFRLKSDTKIQVRTPSASGALPTYLHLFRRQYNAKRRHWRRTKLNI